MKNIHILPTDKPTKIIQCLEVIELLKEEWKSPLGNVGRNIYITSDEEIKEGDWILDAKFNLVELAKYNHKDLKRDWLKIILTTDQDLIKDGVQAIADEFLEWFVKNPSCEEVEVREIEDELISPKNPKIRFNALQDPPSFISAESLNNMIITYKYKIIIPKELTSELRYGEAVTFQIPNGDDFFKNKLI